jgi:hypothetical protein
VFNTLDRLLMHINQLNAPAPLISAFIFADFVFFLSCLEPARCTESTHETCSAVEQCSYYWAEASGSMAVPIFEDMVSFFVTCQLQFPLHSVYVRKIEMISTSISN